VKSSTGIITTLSFLLVASVTVIVINADYDQNEVLYPDRQSYVIPEWVKHNANWWANDHISDAEFSLTIEYLIDNDIIVIDKCVGECVD